MKLLSNKWENNLRKNSNLKKEKKNTIDISTESKRLYHTIRQFPELRTIALSCYHHPNEVQVNTIQNSIIKRMHDTKLSNNQIYNQFKSTKSLVTVLHNQIELSKNPTMQNKQKNCCVNRNKKSLQSINIIGNELNNAVKSIHYNNKKNREMENSFYSITKNLKISKPNNLLNNNSSNNNINNSSINNSNNNNNINNIGINNNNFNNNNNYYTCNNNNSGSFENNNIDHLQKAKNIIFNQCNISVDEGTLLLVLSSGDSNINFLTITEFRQKLYSYLNVILTAEELFALYYYIF
jgi:hypothetical protein